ncbi:MAG: hypothetical protein ACJ75Q_09410 [Gaiellaceae bacterium]
MGRGLIVATLAVIGLLCAAGMGYAAYVVSRGSVAVPVTRLEQAPQTLTPKQVRAKPKRVGTTTTTRTVAPPPTTTVDDRGGDRHGGGSGSSGRGGGGGGGHGGDD